MPERLNNRLEEFQRWVVFPGSRDPGFRPALGDVEWAGPVVRAARDASPTTIQVIQTSGASDELIDALRQTLPSAEIVRLRIDEVLRRASFEDACAVLIDPVGEADWTASLQRIPPGVPVFVPGPEPGKLGDPWTWKGLSRKGDSLEPPMAGQVQEPGAAVRYRIRTRSASAPPPPNLEATVRAMGLIGEHPAWRALLEQAAIVAAHPVPVLIQGETGSGKELIAELVHRLSPRVGEPFVAVNCGALPANLVESTLFGHRKGAFTGAQNDQPGKFVQAHGGTLFLDEIGELPLELQPKLLRVLENGWVEALGAREAVPVDVRIIAATHNDVQESVREGSFRQDLYYRLAFGTLRLPALRERGEDVLLLADHLLRRINRGTRLAHHLSAGARDRLLSHHWPGNVRDLENVIGRSALWCPRETLEAEDILLDPSPRRTAADPWAGLPEPRDGFSLEAFLDGARRHLIQSALAQTNGNQSAAARLLGITPQAVSRFVRDASTG